VNRRAILPAAMALLGTLLLVAAALAAPAAATGSAPGSSASPERRGGTLRVDLTSDFDYVDPALAYFSHSWQLGNAVHLKLLSFPDKEGAAGSRMVPEAAAGMPTVSRDGKTYTFRIKPGFRFSNGQNVTAASFARAFQRALSPQMQSPAKSFLDDVASYRAVNATTFRVTLKTVAPDFLARMTMPFFAAVPANMPLNAQGVGAPMASAGPYYVREWNKGQSALAVRNPHWNNAREPWKSLGRPANVDQIRWAVGITPANQRLRVEANQADMGTFPPAQAKELADRYGLNQGRFFIRKNMVFWYLALNNDRPLFKGNTKLRQAINHALARPYLVAQHGYLGGGRTDQILPPGMPGFRDANVYSLKGANVPRARELARGNLRGGKAVYWAFNTSFGPSVAQAVQFALSQIGLDVDIQQYDRVVQHEKAAERGAAFDITHEGWGADYPDPYNFMNVLLDGRRIQADHNPNTSYFDDAGYNRKLEAASRLSGAQRLQAYGALDAEIMRNAAPLAPYVNTNARVFVSQELGCFNYSNVNSAVNLVAVCKK
jgi:peptide/nickel transport system substrate-binding protein